MEDLTPTQRAELGAQAARELDRAEARIAALQRDLEDIVVSSADAIRDDEHDPEGPTIAFERAQVTALIADARVRAEALRRAAQQLNQPGAERCDACGAPIGYERLLARPDATTCVTCAR